MKQDANNLLGSEFYNRQVIMKELGLEGQRKLGKSRIAIVGLGGLGTVSSLYLSLAGVGHLRLIDQDIVELQNLHRQILYSLDDLQYPKVEVAQRELKKHNPDLEVAPFSENLNVTNAERLLNGVDCVVDGLDNMETRYLVNRVCTKLKIPYVFGAAIGLEGNLSVFRPPETPCLECVLPNIKDSDLQACTTRGVLGVTPGIIGTMQAMEAIKIITGIGSPLTSKLMICDFNDMYFTTIEVAKRDKCPVCQGSVELTGSEEKLIWLCGRHTVNVNPKKPLRLNLTKIYERINEHFKVRLKSNFAIIFNYKKLEISLFKNGRMLIKNVANQKSALKAYREIVRQLNINQ